MKLEGKYDYSKFVYVNQNTKGIIICPEHGEFLLSPNKHIHRNQGCPKCRNQKPRGYWKIKENCINDALLYPNKKQWSKKSSGAYNNATKNGWLDECTNHMKRPKSYNKKWTLEKCKNDALNYKGRKEWQIKSACAYTAAHSYGWLDECCKHMISTIKPMGYWNKERCINEALKYNTKTEWFKKSKIIIFICFKKWMVR